jgi:hypothetical protein
LCYSPDIVRIINSEMRWAWSTNGEKRNAYKILLGKTEGKRSLGTPRHRREDKIQMVLR